MNDKSRYATGAARRGALEERLLIRSGDLDSSVVVEAVRRTFDRRGTHPLPSTLQPPPPEWDKPFQALAEECQLDVSVNTAFEKLSQFVAMVFG
ncbi:MAG TPA: hypothetical protein VN622_03630 [Clostridia bacterium]|nr:hypothetical protein [Clostridia bacterium]